jgi:acyl-[acyl-carrier-protein]-phospholipid O-acyltransferase/long-chain-fatty-acid--[acyl-carrier-protein] ligase
MAWTLNDFRQRKAQAFAWLNATQFFGALNDNVFKMLIQMFLIGLAPGTKSQTLAFATILFALPYLFLTSYAGFLADRFSKKTVTVALKYAELGIMLLSIAAFAAGSRWALFTLLFLMSAQSALFSPTKYGIIPELVPRDRLPRANSLLVVSSFLAVILGSALAPTLAEATHALWPGDAAREGSRYALAQLGCVLFAAAGVFTSLRVWRLRPANPTLDPDPIFVRQIYRTAGRVRQDPPLVLAITATGLFSMIAAFLQINLVRYGMDRMGLNERLSSYLFFFAAVGIAVGAFVAGRLSQRNVEFGTMPVGASLLAVTSLTLGLLPELPSRTVVGIGIFLAGVGAGLYVVPLDAFLQLRVPAGRRGEVLALNSLASWIGILLAGVFLFALSAAGVGAHGSFAFIAVVGFLLAFASLFTLRGFFLRFVVGGLVRIVYRVRTTGIENVPMDAPALLIANHASYMDALLLSATSRRRIRFLMSRRIYDEWRFLFPFFRMLGVIPVSSEESPRQIIQALHDARKALDEGFLVCVFAEGGITRTGTIRAFRRGFERIVRGTDYPIVPVYLGGSWGTIYHYYQGQLVRRWFRMGLRRYRVNVLFGKPLPAATSVFDVRQAVIELSVDYFNARKGEHGSLGKVFVREARRNWSEVVAKDTTGKEFTWGRTLVGAVLLGRAIAPRVRDDRHIGILLPPSCAGMLANVAVTLLGRVAVNLNFTTSRESFASSVEQCGIRTILTSRAFLERFPQLPIPEGSVVYLEDVAKSTTKRQKLAALLRARFARAATVAHARASQPDDVLLVLFSSGSTGTPKGVMLSHHNVLSMLESLRMVLATTPRDRMCAALPLFHSFGIMGTVWYPLVSHVRVTYHPNPLDAGAIAKVVREDRCTLLLSTPTFLSVYLRKAEPADFASLRFILAGAEKLKDTIIRAYEEKYGLRPLEAYGATELSPGIAVSVPHGTGGGIVHEGWREGRVGHPLPGIATKVLDPDTGERLPPGKAGLLYLKGPNVMLGYLGRPDLTEQVLQDGWYCTGDIAFVDEDGFIGITDRLSRFSKIGGEMVPHVAVEEALLTATGLTGAVLAVTGLPDEKKGERLIVLYTAECGDPAWLQQALEGTEIPNLWRPAKDAYFAVDAIPLLGTGKTDLAGVRDLARKAAGGARN